MFRRSQFAVALLLFTATAASARAVTVDDLIARNIKARGGIEKIRAIQSLRTSGKMFIGEGSYSVEASYTQMIRRPGMFRGEVGLQGLTSVGAYDGSVGWQVQPFGGRLDPEKLSADDVKGFQLLADLDGPLVDYQAKGNKVEYLGTEDVDGTDAHKLKVTLKDGDIVTIYLDPDYFLQIRMTVQSRDPRRRVRGGGRPGQLRTGQRRDAAVLHRVRRQGSAQDDEDHDREGRDQRAAGLEALPFSGRARRREQVDSGRESA